MNESEKIDPRELSPLALAFVGDSVLELLVRQRLAEHHRLSAGRLNAEKVKYVSARAQFREEQLLEPLFTEDELAMFKRGRNASKASVSKHASPEEYRASTGFECLLGWLYLNGQLDRVHELFDTLWQQFDPNETRQRRKPAAFRTGKQCRKAAGSAFTPVVRSGAAGQHQRLFLALRLFTLFLALSSSAPLVYWLGCLCSLVVLLVV